VIVAEPRPHASSSELSLTAGPQCPNCGTAAPGNFCPQCGQEQISVRLGLRDLAREFLDDHVGWSTKVPRTLWRLLVPGALTLDFIEGRRARYLSPLRLYLTLSVIFFLVIASVPRRSASPEPGPTVSFSMQGDTASLIGGGGGDDAAAEAARAARADSLEVDLAAHAPDTTTLQGRLKMRFLRRNLEFVRLAKRERSEMLMRGVLNRMPNVMFVMLPVFALLVHAAMWRRRRYYAEHFVFALHTHAFAFAAFTLAVLSPWRGLIPLLLLAGLVYLVAAMRRVYGGSILRNALKATLVGGVYRAVLGTAALAAGIFVCLYG
jgi:predicted RNA-binding Zn-ribbon protein involved in translation (DUF1610 family)